MRDSKIEIVRAAALVLEPWVTAAVESRRFQSRQSSPDHPPLLAPFSFSHGSNKFGTVQPPPLSLSLSHGLSGIQSGNFDVEARARLCAG